jgi:hypothetical protein
MAEMKIFGKDARLVASYLKRFASKVSHPALSGRPEL